MSDPRFVDEDELEGRTIAKVVQSALDVYLRFTDGTWTCISYGGGYYRGEGEIAFVEETDAKALSELGVPPLSVGGSPDE